MNILEAATGRRIKSRMGGRLRISGRDLFGWAIIAPSVVFFLVFNWQPLFSGIYLSFFKTKGYETVSFIGLGNYKDVMTDSVFLKALANTFSYSFWSLLIGFLLPVAAAVIINEMQLLQSFFKFSVYFPSMVPGMASLLMWKLVFDPGQGGLLNMLAAIAGLPAGGWLQEPHLTKMLIVITMTWGGFGGTTLIYIASLQGINSELYEASEIDGAGLFSKLWRITLPSIAGTMELMLIMQIIGVFQIMIEPFAMTDGGPNNASLSLMLQSYSYAFKYMQVGRSTAVGVIVFVMLVVPTAVYYKIQKNNDNG